MSSRFFQIGPTAGRLRPLVAAGVALALAVAANVVASLTAAEPVGLNAAGAPGPALEPAAPVNVAVRVALLRFRPNTPLAESDLAGSRSWPDLFRRLTNHGKVELIHRAVRELACEPMAHLAFRQVETRPAFVLEAGKTVPQTNSYGLSLDADLRWLPTAGPNGQPVALLGWSGSWRGSVQLFSKWEALAVRTFNAARTIPGITYERVEEDEDGFVNTGGTTDLGGLFRRKKKAAPPPPAKAAKGPSKAALASVAPAASGEPEYFSDQVPETVSLSGTWLGAPGDLIVSRHPLVAEPGAGELILVLSVEPAP